jgi:Tol biopolymer transport system component
MNTKRSILSLLIATLILTGCESDLGTVLQVEHPIPIPDATSIIYQATHPQLGWYILLTSGDYIHHHRLSATGFDIAPQWSPDKQWIVFVKGFPDANPSIWKMRFNGSGKTRLTPMNRYCESPTISPHGRIAFTVESGRRLDIFVMDSAGTEWQQITTPATIPFYDSTRFGRPTWSRDGSQILFSYYRPDTPYGLATGIAMIEIASGRLTLIPALDNLHPYNLDWSPTRDEIVFAGHIMEGGPKVFRSDMDGRNTRQLTVSEGAFLPNWSPDGEKIAYVNVDQLGGELTIWIMDRDGTNKRKIIEIPGEEATAPSW